MNLVSVQPAEIKSGDTIQHDGATVQVVKVQPHREGRWIVFFVDEQFGSNWAYYGDSSRPTVSRYEN